jgi:hypothetical protein
MFLAFSKKNSDIALLHDLEEEITEKEFIDSSENRPRHLATSPAAIGIKTFMRKTQQAH